MVATTTDRPVYLRDKEVGCLFDGVFIRRARANHFFDGIGRRNPQLRERGWAYHLEVLTQVSDAELLAVAFRCELFVAEFKQAFPRGLPFSSRFGQQLLIPIAAWSRIAGMAPNASDAAIADLARRRDLWRPVPVDWKLEGWQPRLLPLGDGL